MTLNRIRVNLPTGAFYTFLPEMTIESFESLGIGDTAFSYEHVRDRVGHCWECDRPVWVGQAHVIDDDGDLSHEACHWDGKARREFEANLYKPRYVVVVYDCDREMGGPEEGGWSYEVGQLVTSVAVNDSDAAGLIREGLSLEYPYTGQRGMYSKRGPDFSVYIIDRHEGDSMLDERLEPLAYYPLHTPYYC
jgi:hypothetical protein